MMPRPRALDLLAGLVVVLLASTAHADVVSVEIPYAYYNESISNQGGACYATSVVNSMRFLERRYADHYGTDLTGGTRSGMTSARNSLHTSVWDDPGFTWQEAWEDKTDWIESEVAGRTSYSGMFAGSTDGWSGAEDLIGGQAPTWGYLWDELESEAAVEIFFQWVMRIEEQDVLVGHAVTLTSARFDDADEDGEWDPGVEGAQLGFVDPNSPGGRTWADLGMLSGYLMLRYAYGSTPYWAQTYGAFSANAAPLPPAALGGLTLFGLTLAWRVASRRQSRRRGRF